MVVDWMDSQPAPEAILALLACKYSKMCTLPHSVCLENGLKRTDMCKLSDCGNFPSIEEECPDDVENVDDYEEDNQFDYQCVHSCT